MPYTELTASLREECGVIGVFGTQEDLASTALTGLFALQHRGEESAGLAVTNGQQLKVSKGLGLVADIFNAQIMRELNQVQPILAIGHVRYSTSEGRGLVNAQPFVARYLRGHMALAHNGNLTNSPELRAEMEENGQIFQTNSDSEILLNLIARYRREGIISSLQQGLQKVKGAYSCVLISDDTLLAVRDPYGFRPLVLGRLGAGYVVASESCALDSMGAELIRDVEPGEILLISAAGLESHRLERRVPRSSCVFEYIYFARTDSWVDGINVHQARRRLGQVLAEEQPAEADIVIGVPDSATAAAVGYGVASGLPYDEGLVKNRYIGRTFIQPGQATRETKVRLKLITNRHVLEGKRVVVVDDSIVRGTTSRKLIDILRDAGAREIHMRIASPPYIAPCYYGIDTPSSDELVAARYDVEAIRKLINADSLGYLSLEGMLKAVGGNGYCTSCLTGTYPERVLPGENCHASCTGWDIERK